MDAVASQIARFVNVREVRGMKWLLMLREWLRWRKVRQAPYPWSADALSDPQTEAEEFYKALSECKPNRFARSLNTKDWPSF